MPRNYEVMSKETKSRPKRHRIGIDIGGMQIKAGLFSESEGLVKKTKLPTPQGKSPQKALDSLVQIVQGLQEKTPGSPTQSVGIGMPGVLDRAQGTILQAPNFPGWEGLHLQKELQQRLGCAVFLENDANCAALGELWSGAAKKQRHFLMVTLGTGVGGGLVLDGKLWTGSAGMAGEFGHICVDPFGALCPCGARGCVEAFASAKALQRMADDAGLKIAEIKTLFELQKQGNAEAHNILRVAGNALGRALAAVVQLLDIRFFVIGGGIGQSLESLRSLILEGMSARIYGRELSEIEIVASALGEDAGIYGAAALERA